MENFVFYEMVHVLLFYIICLLTYFHIKIFILVHKQRAILAVNFRSSRPELFCKKGVLKNFTKLTGKTTVPEPRF